MRRYGIIIAAFSILLAGAAFVVRFNEPAISASSSLSRRTAFVGDKVKYAIKVASESKISIDMPDVSGSLSGFDIFDQGFYEKEALGKKRMIIWYLIIPKDSGEYRIPGPAVRYTKEDGTSGTIRTRDSFLTVKSVLKRRFKEEDFTVALGEGLASRGGTSSGTKARRVETPIRIKIVDIANVLGVVTFSDAVFMASLGIAAILAVWFAARFVKKRMNRPAVLSPYENAVKRLGEIASEHAKSKKEPKETYFGLSAILCDYIKNAFNTETGELTTKEFLDAVKGIAPLDEDKKKEIGDLVRLCDLVKFSGYEPDEGETRSNLDATKRLIEEINAALRPKTEK